MSDVLAELKGLVQQAIQIYEDPDLSWEVKYDLIFSAHISRRIAELMTVDYYDPDTSYEEDVTAYVNALKEKLNL